MATMNETANSGSLLNGGFMSILDLPPEGSFYYTLEPFLSIFYLVHPKRTMLPTMETPNFFMMTASRAPALFLIEFIVLLLKGKPLYRLNDALAGACAMIAGSIPQIFLEKAIYTFYSWLNINFRFVDVPYDSWWTWLICIFAADLSFYVAHRLTHEVNILWASHQLHHSSEFYNYFTAARNSFSDKLIVAVCTLPWAFVLPVGPMRSHHQLNFAYQFWIHTQIVGDLGWLEYILVTPTQHAIHHGRNRFCIDVNFGGFLCIWDYMFNTMVSPRNHKDVKIYYGLVHPVASWDVIYLYGHSYLSIFRRVLQYETIADKLSAVFKGPGWDKGKPRLGNLEEIPEVPVVKEPYNKESPVRVYIYGFIHAIFCYAFNTSVLLQFETLPAYLILIGLIFSTWTIANIGYILEYKTFVPKSEWLRCAAFFIVSWLFADNVLAPFAIILPVLKVWFTSNIVFWSLNLDYFPSKEVTDRGDGDKVKVN